MNGIRPDLTAADKLGSLVALVPILANLLAAFGVYDLSAEQRDALEQAITWGTVFAVGLVGGDKYLRGKRNDAQATVDAAALAPIDPLLSQPPLEEEIDDPDADGVPDADLPDDAEEFASPPPER